MMSRKKILVSAYAFSPYQGSECAIGWNIATRLAKVYDVTVLCGDLSSARRMKADLDRYFSMNPPVAGLTIHYVDPDWLIRLIEQLHTIPGLWMLYYLAYNLWQRKAYRTALDLHAKCPFDLAHQLTMQGYREPGYLWEMPVPFVWGPVGGSVDEPLSFLSLFSARGKISVVSRCLCNTIQKRLSRRARCASHKASTIWAATPADVNTIETIWKVNAVPMIDMGGAANYEECAKLRNGHDSLRLVWSGLFLPRKALPIVLHALFRLSSTDRDRCVLTVLGNGREENSWKALSEQLGLSNMINWKGMLPRDNALQIMKTSHVCIISSIKESASAVTMEALSLGLPVICHDACGMGIAVTETCGIKIPLHDPETSIKGFAQAIHRLLNDRALEERLSRGALARAAELSWDRKVSDIVDGYEKAIAQEVSE